MRKTILDFKSEKPLPSFDLDGMVLHECVCGCNVWKVAVAFQDYEIAWYALDMECLNCGTRAKAPTPLDKEES